MLAIKVKTALSALFFTALFFCSCDGDSNAPDTIEEQKPYSYTGDVVLTTQQQVDSFGQIGYREIIGSVIVKEAPNTTSITDLNGLSSLFYITNKLRLEGLSNIENFDALNALKEVDSLYISHNPLLTDLNGFNELSDMRHIQISDNRRLQGINGFNDMRSIIRLIVSNNPELIGLTGFKGTRYVWGFHLSNNDALESVNGFPALKKLTLLYITRNDKLEGINFLRGVDYPSVYSLNIERNAALRDLDGLDLIKNVETHISIYRNDALTNIDGLRNIEQVGNYFHIGLNDALTNLNGLSRLSFINNWLHINENGALSDLCGLQNLVTNGSYDNLFIEENLLNPSVDDIRNGVCNQ